MARFDGADVRDYYEANTPAFVAYGLGWLERHSDRAAALAGGSALHRCLVRGWVAYEMRIFRRG